MMPVIVVQRDPLFECSEDVWVRFDGSDQIVKTSKMNMKAKIGPWLAAVAWRATNAKLPK